MLNYTKEEAKQHVSYAGDDMNWMMFHGELDYIFPPEESKAWAFQMFSLLDVNDTILYDYTKPGNWHMEDGDYFRTMMTFVRTGEVVPITPKELPLDKSHENLDKPTDSGFASEEDNEPAFKKIFDK